MRMLAPADTLHVSKELELLTSLVKTSDVVLVYAGAGMSVEIGNNPYWAGRDAKYGGEVTQYGLTPVQHATAQSWTDNPAEQIKYVTDLRKNFQQNLELSNQNLYTELLRVFAQYNTDYHVVTSNVDNAFLHYGYDPDKIFERHGNYFYDQCVTDRTHPVVPHNPAEITCGTCGSLLRPNVLMFYDVTFSTQRETKQWYAYDDKIATLEEGTQKILLLEIGVGTVVLNIRDTATKAYYRLKTAPYVHVNPAKDDLNNYSQIALLRSSDKPAGKQLWIPATGEEFTQTLLLER